MYPCTNGPSVSNLCSSWTKVLRTAEGPMVLSFALLRCHNAASSQDDVIASMHSCIVHARLRLRQYPRWIKLLRGFTNRRRSKRRSVHLPACCQVQRSMCVGGGSRGGDGGSGSEDGGGGGGSSPGITLAALATVAMPAGAEVVAAEVAAAEAAGGAASVAVAAAVMAAGRRRTCCGL